MSWVYSSNYETCFVFVCGSLLYSLARIFCLVIDFLAMSIYRNLQGTYYIQVVITSDLTVDGCASITYEKLV